MEIIEKIVIIDDKKFFEKRIIKGEKQAIERWSIPNDIDTVAEYKAWLEEQRRLAEEQEQEK